jgi:predicted enzyme related to lactoylglutathione lyase
MIGGMHTIFYSQQPEAVCSFFRDVLRLPCVDAGHGWLIFAAPPSEIAVHPDEGESHSEVYLMCTDLESEVKALQAKGVEFAAPITEQRWGRLTHLKLPGGQSLGLYEPHHPMAIRMSSAKIGAAKKRRAVKTKTNARKASKTRRRRS